MKRVLSIALIFCILLAGSPGSVAHAPPPAGAAVDLAVLSTEESLTMQPLTCAESLGQSEGGLGYSVLPIPDYPLPGPVPVAALPVGEGEEVALLAAAETAAPVVEEAPQQRAGSVAAITPSLGLSVAEKRAQNSDTVGWLTIPGTTVDTPVVANPEGDNNFYTTHNFWRGVDANGAYGTDFRCNLRGATRESLQRNTTVYAHNLTEDPNGALFAQLKKYKDPEFARTHPYIYFSTDSEDMVFEVFAVFDSNTDLPYIVPDLTWDIYERILDVAYRASIYDYGVTITPQDRILTLSTCSFNVPGRDPLPLNVATPYRFVVKARLVDADADARETVNFVRNDAPLAPDRMPAIYHPGLDVFCWGGAVYATDPRWGLQRDFSGAQALGEISRTGISYDLEHGDATSLPVGAVVVGYAEWDGMLAVERDGVQVTYVKYWWPDD